ncbi:ABC transporter ATP-binding protein [Cylindrospermopsis raciborskii S07]|uniref:LuxR family transcriptional regulator n=2 Tax=Cylindrospermopsis raciborskii TaxID=77022 RepID=A0A853MAN1_9CYAN|nr:ABC transporter ATP-binding protein [Cylindrospermopsis raciborskii]EFA69849.1 ABC transporter, transmembrane region protein [Cylindrospermopsis raciborskii CS-505]OBU75505.1 LuxR family transcriptional regulator [Cylindrospermopsis raciborskii CS-505]OHY42327.1 LuxR family transcriptional regulator [Cylindrospermopsis raciborskii CS-508]PNJ90684.1 ABC transporter ATP-binding protein [Cylindrospermopsis raciborskii C03]PNJ91080.1 ABC transporter ATP-binding protein [Cylindrospermopsis racib
MTQEPSQELSNYRLLLPYLQHQWPTISRGFIGIIGYVFATLTLIHLAGKLALPFGEGNVVAIAQLTGVCALVFLIRGFFQSVQDLYMSKVALGVAFHLRQNVYTHLQKLNLSYFETAKAGDLSYRLTEDVDRVGEVVNKLFHDFIPCVLQLIAIPIYMIYLNWQLTLATVIVAPIMGVLIGWFGERLRKYALKSQNRISDLSAILTEVFSGIRLIQAFAAEKYEIARFTHEAQRTLKAKYSAEKLKAIQIPIVGFLEALSALSLIMVGVWQISQKNLTVGEFFSYLAAAALLIDPIGHTTHNYNEFKQGEASLERVFELLAIKATVLENPIAMTLPSINGKIEYRGVSFAYKPGELVLNHVSLFISPGESIALVGASGAGKTTFVNLLPRFYDPKSGNIFIDDVNIRDVTLNSLRKQIGIVPQETIMFSGTIAQNIAFGQDNFDQKAVEAAARVANAHDFIMQLPAGYQTWVGERGVNLSGGQRQRIAIARAVLLNPKILILDEATSALDSESEALVQQALERLMQNRTVLIIAHRLSTVRKCDRILVLEKGQIVESGNHEQLLSLEGKYAHFYAQQFSQS